MMADDEPVVHCQLTVQADLLAALDATAIEHLEVDENRTVVIYQSAILRITMTDGQLTAARAFDVELWDPPTHAPDRDPADHLDAFLDEIVAATSTERC